MPLTMYQVDAFAERPFTGNPAGVCVLPAPKSDEWMQAVAEEMNLAETAFLVREGDAWRLRWFTPVCEVVLCGHATLASAHVLWEAGHLPPTEVAKFDTRSGVLTAAKRGDFIELDFPSEPVAESLDVDAAHQLAYGLGVVPVFVGRNRMDFFAQLESEAAVRGLNPRLDVIGSLPCRGVIATAKADAGSGIDYVSRFFAPQCAVPEDPVTGSAHCALAPFWSERLGRKELVGFQASKRGGRVVTDWLGERVLLRGRAVVVFRADWFAE